MGGLGVEGWQLRGGEVLAGSEGGVGQVRREARNIDRIPLGGVGGEGGGVLLDVGQGIGCGGGARSWWEDGKCIEIHN